MLELVFLSFNTESSYDVVYVYDGGSPSANLIGRFSGNSIPPLIASSSNKLYVRFTSDSSGTFDGFRARYRGMFSLTVKIDFICKITILTTTVLLLKLEQFFGKYPLLQQK